MRRGLGFHNRRSPGTVFSPLSLFTGGVNGAWYDPSDSSTLFTTSAGTTPCAEPGAGALVVVGRMLDKSGNGNHANAANDTTARPELSARVNLLTYTEEFDNAAWTKGGGAATKNVIAAPNGTTTGNSFVAAAGTANHWMFRAINVLVGQKIAVYAKAGPGASWLNIGFGGGGTTDGAFFDLTNGVVGTVVAGLTASISKDASTGWCLCVVNTTGAGARAYVSFEIHTADNQALNWNATGGETIYIWGADLRPANIGANVPAYQRVADQYTYDTVGFPRYLRFDGVDDAMSTPANVNLSGTDKVTVFAGVRKLATTNAAGAIAEFSTTWFSNNGTFVLYASDGTNQNFGWGSSGTAGTSYVAPLAATQTSYVATGIGNIPGDVTQLRLNGAVAATDTADQGTGNFGSYPLFIGARNKASVFLNGNIYSLIVVGAASSAGQISSTETWVAGKTGITI